MMQKPIWEQKRPKKLGASKPLTPAKKAIAKKMAKNTKTQREGSLSV